MPVPSCMVRRWAMSEPRKTRLEMSDRYSSFFKKSESNNATTVSRCEDSSRHLGRFGRRLQDIGDDGVGRHTVGLALEIEDDAVTQGHGSHGADVFAGDVVAAVEDGAQLGRQDNGLGTARAAAVAHVLPGHGRRQL